MPGRGRREIEVNGTINTKVQESADGIISKLPDHTPGLMREAVKQMVLSGAIAKWHSSPKLTEGGQNIYTSLADDPQLRVEMQKRPGDEKPHYVVRKNEDYGKAS